MALSPKVSLAFVAACSLAAFVPRVVVAQNITFDGRFSSAKLTAPNYVIDANQGRQFGGNLFHSFGKFNLSNAPVPESATFTSTGSTGPISNVIGRVTGGNPSSIDGRINGISGASLYLINPSGIVFGSSATVNVTGGFHASTADYLKLKDGAKFQATNPDASTFSSASPAAFGFLTATPAAITVNGGPVPPAPAAAPSNLGLVAGPVTITGGTLRAPAGTIQVTAVAGAGEVPVNPGDPSALTVTSFGPVDIKSSSSTRSLLTSTSGGSVFIRSGALTIDMSTIAANNSGAGPGGQLVLRGDNQVTLRNDTSVQASNSGSGSGVAASISTSGALTIDASTIAANNSGARPGGQLVLRGDNQVTLRNGTQVQALNSGSGSGAAATISTSGALTIDASTIAANNSGAGPGGQLVLRGDNQVTLRNDTSVQASNSGSGSGAAATISTGGALTIDASNIQANTSSPAPNAGRGGSIAIQAGDLIIRNGASVLAQTFGPGAGGGIGVLVDGSLTVASGASLGTTAFAAGNAGGVSVMVAGPITIDMSVGPPSTLNGIASFTVGHGNAGNVSVTARDLAITSSGKISSFAFDGVGNSGDVAVKVSGMLSVDGLGTMVGAPTVISASSLLRSSGNAGRLSVTAGSLSLANDGAIQSNTNGPGRGGGVTISAGNLMMASSGRITSDTSGSGNAGSVSVAVDGQLKIDGSVRVGNFPTEIAADSLLGSSGNAGGVAVRAGTLSIINGGVISSNAFASAGNPGQVTIFAGDLSIAGSGSKVESSTSGSGSGGGVAVTAGGLSITDFGQITSTSSGAGRAGDVSVNVTGGQPGALTILTNGSVSAGTSGGGDAGSVLVTVVGGLSIDGSGTDPTAHITGITSQANRNSTGTAGSVTVSAGSLSIVNGGAISTTTFESGNAGNVSVTAGVLSIAGSGEIVSNTKGSGKGGSVLVNVDGQLTIDGTSPIANLLTGVAADSVAADSEAGSRGNGGDVTVNAGALSIFNGGAISSSALGSTGNAGPVTVTAGILALGNAGLIASATKGTGSGGKVSVTAGSLTIAGGDITSSSFGTGFGSGRGGNISVEVTGNQPGALTILADGVVRASTFGPGDAGSVAIRVAGGLSIDGTGTRISSQANTGSRGNAGDVFISAGTLLISNGARITTDTAGPGAAGTVTVALDGSATLSSGALITSSTSGEGAGGSVQVTAQGPLILTDPGTGITALAASTASGNAGSVIVAAPQLTITKAGQIASTTAGMGAGGSVNVMTPGALVLDGAGVSGTQIAASATGPQSGRGGSVSVQANTLTVGGGAQIASSTAGPGTGGDVTVTVASDIMLSDPGRQITALSTGSGDAGSITVWATRLLMNNDAVISTEAVGQRSAASGGNITLHVRDFLYLVSSEISTSVKGQTGNGGNITIDPQFVILNHSSIIAQAIEGHGGNITITAGQFIPSSDSIISATSQLGISGTVVINGPRVDVNGALVVLSSQLRGRTEVLREACAARAGRPISSLVEAGRGGLPQDPEATLPALYIAGRDVNPNRQITPGTAEASSTPLHTTARLTMRCG